MPGTLMPRPTASSAKYVGRAWAAVAATILELRAQATLSTRPERKSGRWLTLPPPPAGTGRAGARVGYGLVGARRDGKQGAVAAARTTLPLDVIDSLGADVVAAVGEEAIHLASLEPHCRGRAAGDGLPVRVDEDREAIVGLVVDAAEAASLRLTPPAASHPARPRSADRTARACSGRSTPRCSPPRSCWPPKTASSNAPTPPPHRPCADHRRTGYEAARQQGPDAR